MRSICTVEGCDKFVKGHGYCNRHYATWKRTGDARYERQLYSVCQADGCDKASRSRQSPLCEKHYYRLRRTGTIDLGIRERKMQDRGYVVVKRPDHPLAPANGWLYEHRMVLWNELNGADPECFWCGRKLTWGRALHVDHVDHDRSNNDPANLVPTCLPCNTSRKKGDVLSRWARLSAERQFVAAHEDEIAALAAEIAERHASRRPA